MDGTAARRRQARQAPGQGHRRLPLERHPRRHRGEDPHPHRAPGRPHRYPYASDLPITASSADWGIVQRDKSPAGNPITIEGVHHAKGLGAHAESSALFYLGGGCRTFDATVGIDDEDGPQGSVTFEVWADGRKVAESGVIRGTDPGQSFTADVTGAGEVELRTTDAADGNYYDHSDWAEARFTC
ncbi:NPCBM/NEW2 domain-containing protein [Streptomyces sp. NPDC002825]|uniref:NPCBM/NEW2 domain-containing protein n=1 Tax=Streptomyces sp. NPDC002825 TaxID=3154666 RepID=UPI0033297FF9